MTSGNKLENSSSRLLHGGSLKSHIIHTFFCFIYTRSKIGISFLLCSSHVYIWIYLFQKVFRTARSSLLHNSCLSQHHSTCGSIDLVIHFPVPVFFVSVNTSISKLLHSSSLKTSYFVVNIWMFHVAAIRVLFQSHMNSSCSYVTNSFDLDM